MTLTKFQLAMAAMAGCVVASGLAWEIHANRVLRSEITRAQASARTTTMALEKQLASQSERAAAAEARVTALLKKAEAAKSARSTTSAPAATAALTIDTEDAAKAAIARATQLVKEGKQREALDEYVKCYREIQPLRPGSGPCQRLMSAMQYLGRTYPDARTALAGLRDASMAQRQAEPNRRELVFEIALLNERLGEGSRTIALYDSLPPNDMNRQSLAMIANAAFIEARRYSDALLGKPFGSMVGWIEAGAAAMAKQDAARQPEIRKAVIDATVTNIEVLTGADKPDEARMLTEKLLVFDNSESTRLALKQHVERAQLPRP